MEDERRVVVIGTGPAGAAAAWSLHNAGIAVTVLEAGGARSADGFVARIPGMTILRRRRELPRPEQGVPSGGKSPQWFREIAAGGLSNHWTCAVPRFSPEDFTDGEALGERFRWPISYSDLGEHYPAMERILQIGGSGEDVFNLPAGVIRSRVKVAPDWKPVVEQAATRGHGLTSLPLAYGAAWTVTRSGTPFNSYVRMLADIPRSEKFEIRFGARALRLEWSTEKRRISRAIYRGVSGKEESISGQAFVIAAGCLDSTRLLLESSAPGAPNGLGNGEGLLGRFLHDHPLGKVGFRVGRPLSIHPPVYLTRPPFGSVPPLRGVAAVLWSGTSWRLRSYLRLRADKSDFLGFNLFGTLPPEEKNGVALQRDKRDADGVAGLELRLSFDADTDQMLISARDRVAEILAAAGLAPEQSEWMVESPGNSVHLGGTARMHASPKHGVLDGWNRVYGAPNVLVVDSAAFTTGPEKNPTLTAMAIAARASDRLAADLRGT